MTECAREGVLVTTDVRGRSEDQENLEVSLGERGWVALKTCAGTQCDMKGNTFLSVSA